MLFPKALEQCKTVRLRPRFKLGSGRPFPYDANPYSTSASKSVPAVVAIVLVIICMYPSPPPRVGCDTKPVFKRIMLVWIQNSLSWLVNLTNAKEPNPTTSPVSWDSRIHRLHLCRGVRPLTNECPRYDAKLSDSDAPVIELRGKWRTFSLALLPGPLWHREVVLVWIPYIDQI